MIQDSHAANRFTFLRPRESGRSRRFSAPSKRSRNLILEGLEARLALSGAIGSLGAAGTFAILGLQGTTIVSLGATVAGSQGISQAGSLWSEFSTIKGPVTEAAAGQVHGLGAGVTVNVDPTTMAQADSAAVAFSTQAAALSPTQTLPSITQSTTVSGNGGLNVIDITGSISNSLILNGSSSDVFIVNVSGGANLFGNAALGLAGGVTADHVLYNFTASRGSINVFGSGGVNGTLLAPGENVNLMGSLNGRGHQRRELVESAARSGGQPRLVFAPRTGRRRSQPCRERPKPRRRDVRPLDHARRNRLARQSGVADRHDGRQWQLQLLKPPGGYVFDRAGSGGRVQD
jgi:choice-of-anchor A domain-containing protein